MSTVQLGDALQSKYAARLNQRKINTAEASIENTVSDTTNNTSIEVPEEIKSLNVGTGWLVRAKTNRYKMLIRQGYLQHLLYLANMARTKQDIRNPANWFAHVCSVKKWEAQTLPFLKKAMAAAQKAAEVAERLKTPVTNFIRKQIWKGVNVICLAVQAQETGRNPERYFMWLCLHETAAGS